MIKTKNSFLGGAIILTLCSVITKILSAVYKIPLLKILGSDGLGGFQMVIGIYALFLVISSGGIVVTNSKIIAREEKKFGRKNQKTYLKASILQSIFLSTFLGLILLAVSPILSNFQGLNDLLYCYLFITPCLLFSGIINAFRGYFLGKKNMLFSGGILIFEAGAKLLFSLFFAIKFSKFGVFNAVLGAIIGITATEIISFLFALTLFFVVKKRQNNYGVGVLKNDKRVLLKIPNSKNKFQFIKSKSRYVSFLGALKEVFVTSSLVSLQALIFPLITAIDGVLIVPLLTKIGFSQSIAYSLFGLEDGVVSTILSMPTIVASSIGSAIIPSLNQQKNNCEVIKKGFSIVWIVSIFCALCFIAFATDITKFLYGSGLNFSTIDEIGIASDLLKVSGFNIIYIGLLSLSTSILQGLDRSFVPIKNLVIAGVLRFVVLSLCLESSNLNIYGIAISNMVFYATAMMLNLRVVKKLTSVQWTFNKLFMLPSICAVTMLAISVFAKSILSGFLSSKLLTLFVLCLSGLVYVSMLFATKVLNIADFSFIKNKKKST